MERHNDLKELHKIIETILKARKIQKTKADENIMREELTQEGIEKLHKPMIELKKDETHQFIL
jgi:hypothetical protein